MNKNIGFRRNIHRHWLDAAASFAVETTNIAEVRTRLEPIVGATISSRENRRMAIDILVNIWLKNAEQHPVLYGEAIALFADAYTSDDHLWLHYGLTMLYYTFFRSSVAAIGRSSTYSNEITGNDLKKHLFAELGQLGAIDKAAARVIFSLRDWGILAETERKNIYKPCRQALTTDQPDLERWLLAAVLTAHPAEEMSFSDLVRLPELFPFRLSITVDALRTDPQFEIHRQGLGWDMVRLAPTTVHHVLLEEFAP